MILCAPSPNAILRELRTHQAQADTLVAARRLGMHVDERTREIFGDAAQWQQLRLNDLIGVTKR